MTCNRYTRAFLHNLVARGIPFAAMLVSYHNIAFTQQLTQQIRDAISKQHFPQFVQQFVRKQYPSGDIPLWVRSALAEADIHVT
jgi:queuine tRNA-ribosyltransferase